MEHYNLPLILCGALTFPKAGARHIFAGIVSRPKKVALDLKGYMRISLMLAMPAHSQFVLTNLRYSQLLQMTGTYLIWLLMPMTCCFVLSITQYTTLMIATFLLL